MVFFFLGVAGPLPVLFTGTGAPGLPFMGTNFLLLAWPFRLVFVGPFRLVFVGPFRLVVVAGAVGVLSAGASMLLWSM
jgi:hypothetical protein